MARSVLGNIRARFKYIARGRQSLDVIARIAVRIYAGIKQLGYQPEHCIFKVSGSGDTQHIKLKVGILSDLVALNISAKKNPDGVLSIAYLAHALSALGVKLDKSIGRIGLPSKHAETYGANPANTVKQLVQEYRKILLKE